MVELFNTVGFSGNVHGLAMVSVPAAWPVYHHREMDRASAALCEGPD